MSRPVVKSEPPEPDVLSEAQRVAMDAEIERRVALRIDEARAAQARSEAQFRASFESDAVGQMHQDPVTGIIIRANRCFAQMLGYEPQELIGRAGADFTWPEDKSRAPYDRLVAGKVETYSREKRYLRRDGTPIWGRVSASIVRQPGAGEPLLAVSVVEDIDDRKKAELALEQTLANLTSALAQRDLLLREVYHRVKNNLQIIDSLMLMQARRVGGGEAGAALANLRSRVQALGLVHSQLMGSDDLETLDLAAFLEEISRHLLAGVGEQGVRLSVRAAPIRVGLDIGIPLGLIVTELLTNSVRHAFPDGQGEVSVALSRDEPDHLVLEVADNGQGYDPQTAAPSLGRTIIEGLVRQVQGVMTVTPEGGVHTVVRLPLSGAA